MSRTPKKKQTIATVRCAVYTRKSTEEGLEQEFNTLDAQRESGEAYIASQKNEGWQCLAEHYDDGGFSGGNMDRPALERLLADIKAGKVDCVVVYKVDRLSRSLLDFAKIMEVFDQQHVAFVSVTQQFNTSTPMGRLVLNVLLSFAQFEREIIGERIRDKIAAQRRKGKWAGGTPVLGYDVDRSNCSPKLVVNAEEAVRVREIFDLYLQSESLLPVVNELADRGWCNKSWKTKSRRGWRPRRLGGGKQVPYPTPTIVAEKRQQRRREDRCEDWSNRPDAAPFAPGWGRAFAYLPSAPLLCCGRSPDRATALRRGRKSLADLVVVGHVSNVPGTMESCPTYHHLGSAIFSGAIFNCSRLGSTGNAACGSV
jgi:DNA invertase Pin-like site-specific DNA recombinase